MWLCYTYFNVHFSLYVFLLMIYYLLFILYLFWTMEMMLDKTQIRAIFSSEFQMGHKAALTTHNINNAFRPGTANTHTVQWWFKKFRKGGKSLEGEEHSGQPSEADNNREQSLKRILLQLQEKLLKNSTSQPFYNHLVFEANWKVKKLVNWVPHELTANQKKTIALKYILLFYTTTKNYYSIGLFCEMKSGFYMTTGGDASSVLD